MYVCLYVRARMHIIKYTHSNVCVLCVCGCRVSVCACVCCVHVCVCTSMLVDRVHICKLDDLCMCTFVHITCESMKQVMSQ
jgi:hypothetical protein